MAKSIFKEIPDLEALLGLPAGFYDRLLDEDDWSFIIKLSSLFEGACTHALSARFDKPELFDSLSHLEMAGQKVGKIVMLKQLGALTKDQFLTLKQLAELRNKMVHRIANVTFQFRPYLESLSTSDFNTFVRAFGHGIRDEITVRDRAMKIRKPDFIKLNARVAIWMTCSEILACLYLDLALSALERKTYAARVVSEHYQTINDEFPGLAQLAGQQSSHVNPDTPQP